MICFHKIVNKNNYFQQSWIKLNCEQIKFTKCIIQQKNCGRSGCLLQRVKKRDTSKTAPGQYTADWALCCIALLSLCWIEDKPHLKGTLWHRWQTKLVCFFNGHTAVFVAEATGLFSFLWNHDKESCKMRQIYFSINLCKHKSEIKALDLKMLQDPLWFLLQQTSVVPHWKLPSITASAHFPLGFSASFDLLLPLLAAACILCG